MIDRLEVTPGAGTVIRYGGIVAWADPSASAALISFLAQSARNLSPSPRGGRQIADHIAGVLASRDPEPHVAFAVIGPSDHGWASLLHGPVQAWDGARWLAPTPTPGWLQAIITPRPAITVSAAGTPTPAPEPDAMWDLEAGVVPGSGFVLLPSGVPGRYATVRPPAEEHLEYQRDVMAPDAGLAAGPGDQAVAAGGPVAPVVATTTALPAVEPTLLLGAVGDVTESRQRGKGEVTGGAAPEDEPAGAVPAGPAPAREPGVGAAAVVGAALGAAALRGRDRQEASPADETGSQEDGAASAGESATEDRAVAAGAAAIGARAEVEPVAPTAPVTPAADQGAATGPEAEGMPARGIEPEPVPAAAPEGPESPAVRTAAQEATSASDGTSAGGDAELPVADGQAGPAAEPVGTNKSDATSRATAADVPPAASPRRLPVPGPAGSVDLRTVATTAGPPLPRGGGPDQRVPGAPVVAGALCARGHLNRPGLAVCARCRTPIPDGAKEQVSGTRPPLGVLIMDDGTIYRLDRGYLVGSAPGRDPTVGGGLARPLILRGSDVSGSHAELRLADWDVLIVDRGSAAGTCVFEPGASEWARLGPFEPRTLLPGTHVAFGQRVMTFLSPWVAQG